MRTLTFFLGKKGTKGATGLDGVSTDEVRESLLDNPLFSAFHPNNVSDINVNWSRDASATITDRYGNLELLGGDFIENILPYSEDFSQWADPGNYWSITNSSVADPLGGNDARRIKLDLSTFPSGVNVMEIGYSAAQVGLHTFSFYIKSVSGTVENVGVQFTNGGSVFTLSDPVTSDWQRISITLNTFTTITDFFSINVYGLANVEFDIFGAQLSYDQQVIDYVKTTGSPVSGANPEPRYRANQAGYLIENAKDNISLYSENLQGATWTITGGNITAFSGKDPKGRANTPTQVNFTDSNCIISNSGTFSNGETYSVSFWVYNNIGAVDSALISVGGGSPVQLVNIPTDKYTRVFVKCIAGGSGGVTINLTTSDVLSKVQIFGVQAELGEPSSYINTIDEPSTRAKDLVSIDYPYNFPKPDSDWSILFTSILEGDNNLIRYVFHNGLTGSNEFSLRFENGLAVFKHGLSVLSYQLTSGNFEFIYSGGFLSLYSDSVLINQFAVNQPCTSIGTTLHIGSDLNEENQLEAFFSTLYVYEEALTVSEIRYFRGSDA